MKAARCCLCRLNTRSFEVKAAEKQGRSKPLLLLAGHAFSPSQFPVLSKTRSGNARGDIPDNGFGLGRMSEAEHGRSPV